jgi:hypothetical protein
MDLPSIYHGHALQVPPPVYVLGDIHANLYDLEFSRQ